MTLEEILKDSENKWLKRNGKNFEIKWNVDSKKFISRNLNDPDSELYYKTYFLTKEDIISND